MDEKSNIHAEKRESEVEKNDKRRMYKSSTSTMEV